MRAWYRVCYRFPQWRKGLCGWPDGFARDHWIDDHERAKREVNTIIGRGGEAFIEEQGSVIIHNKTATETKMKKQKERVEFLVSFDRPPLATINDMKGYVSDAVTTWCGQLRPPGALGEHDDGDPMRYVENVRVKRFIRET